PDRRSAMPASSSTSKNKQLVRQVIEEIFNKGNLSLIDKLVSSGHSSHDALDQIGPSFGISLADEREGLRQTVMALRTAVPDLHYTINDMMAEGNKVLVHWTARGTYSGALGAVQPTGQQVAIDGMSRIVVSAGQCDRLDTYSDLP